MTLASRMRMSPAVLLVAAAAGCGPRAIDTGLGVDEAVLARIESEPRQNVLLWTVDETGREETVWIEGTSFGGAVVAKTDGLVLVARESVWTLEWEKGEIPLCDCEAWSVNGMTGACPSSEQPAHIRAPVLVDVSNGARIEIVSDSCVDGDGAPLCSSLASTATIAASVGPLLFLRREESSHECGSPTASRNLDMVVFDLAAGEPRDLFTEAELSLMFEEEREAALKQMRSDRLVAIERAEDLELTAVVLALVPGLGMALRYEFTVSATFADDKGNTSAYTRTVEVEARRIPEALAPHVVLPAALRAFSLPADGRRVVGWTPITATEQQLDALRAAFAME